MPKIPSDLHRKKQAFLTELDLEFEEWRPHYLEIGRYFLPRLYPWLSGDTKPTAANYRNTTILDGTGTEAARTLAHGLLNSIASPTRPWFELRLQDFPEDYADYPIEYQRWLQDTNNRMLVILAESNFYNSLGSLFLNLNLFGSGAFIIYEDFEEVIRCYNPPVGEFRFIVDDRQLVVGLARTFDMKVHQIVSKFGLSACSPQIQQAYRSGGASLMQSHQICHLIERRQDEVPVPKQFRFQELYWEKGKADGSLLRLAGFAEQGFMGVRWDVTGSDTYGSSPGMDALPDVKQLQLETKQKAQALDKMIRPPIVADVALQSNPTALLPGGVAYVPSASNFGAKPIFTVSPPLGEMTNDIMKLQERIRRFFYNNLFRNVSDLSTVRTAAEIYERKSEDMVILGAVLERFENEALSPIIQRVFKIMQRKGLLLPPPAGIEDEKLEVKYVSILAAAQRNASVTSIERAWQTVGQLGSISPEILDIPNWDESIRHYYKQLGVPAITINSRQETERLRAARQAQLELQQAALVGSELTSAAKNLSETKLGAGNTVLDQLM